MYAETSFADSGEALFKGCKAANHNTVSIDPAPRIVLGLAYSGGEHGRCGDYTEYKQPSHPPRSHSGSIAHASIRVSPLEPAQRMWSWRWLVLRIAVAEPANPAHGVETLLKGCETAVRAAAVSAVAVVRAPRIILGFGAISRSDDTDANS